MKGLLVMEFEVLKRSHLKRNIIIGVVVVAVISAIVLNFTRAKYRTTQSIPLVNGTINYTPYDFKLIAMYQQNDSGEYESIDTVPESGYQLNEELSYCEVNDTRDNSISIEYQDGKINFLGMTTKGTKCYLYFDEQLCNGNACNTILANKDIQERSDFSTTLSTNTNGIIFEEQTSDGTTYYFAGDTDENWVSFAGYYWRIIRINEDGSIKMIYNGTTTNQTGTTTQVQTSAFNSASNNNMYVGYMYQSNQVHGLTSSSTIKGVLDGWYEENLLGEPEEDLISTEAGFCGDRTSTTTDGGAPNDTGGTGTTVTYYGATYRLYTNKTPTFECPDEDNDLYTVDGSSKGNHALDYPIGLITADEVAYAGGVYNTNNYGYYLYTNSLYWTMSPYYFNFNRADMFIVYSRGGLSYVGVSSAYGVRPVLNLKAEVTISSGDGTSSSPFVVN